MRYVRLGRTELSVSEVGFGCIPIIRLPRDEAVKVLWHAFDRGVTFFDTANAYSDSEEKIGRAFRGIRKELVLATKTSQRGAVGAVGHLENSLKMLQTDCLDLYQLHQVAQEKDFEEAFSPGGVYNAVLEAKKAGKVRFVGVTSHNLAMAVRLTKTGLFDTVQFPFNLIEEAASKELFTAVAELDMAFIAMKPFGGGVINDARVAFRYLRQFSDVIPIPGFESVAQVDEVLSFYERPNEVEPADLEAMERFRAELGKRFCRRCEYCQPCPQGVIITPAMGYPIIASRMGPAVASRFAGRMMDSVTLCNECGTCLARCPYELDIPTIIRENYALYRKHVGAP